MNLTEPRIDRKQILTLADKDFRAEHVCIVTGGGNGIGRAMALAAGRNELTVAVVDIDSEAGRETVRLVGALGGKAHFLQADLTQDAAAESMVREAAQLGRIKYLANIAGIQHIDLIENFPMEKYDLMQRLMLRAPFFLSKLVIPYLKENDAGGVIGNMASIHAHISTLAKPAYNILKFGLRGLTQSIAAEGGGRIRAFSVSTGYVKTGLVLKQIPAQARQRAMTEAEVVQNVMLGRSQIKEMMQPVDVANLFMFGFSRYSRHLNGGDLLFDGGVVHTY